MNVKTLMSGDMMNIRNLFCIGRNYADHAVELGNKVPNKPMVFLKPTNSLVLADGKKIDYPNNCGEIHYEIEIVLYIGNDVDDGHFSVDEIVTKMALGVDLTKRDVQTELKMKGHPWLLSKGFKNAAIMTDFWSFPGEEGCSEKDFALKRNGNIVQQGNITSMIFSMHHLIKYIHEQFGLKQGDVIFTGTPEGVGPISNGDIFELWWGDKLKGSFGVQM